MSAPAGGGVSGEGAAVAAGVRRREGWRHSVFIDGEGRLSSCGSAAQGEEDV